MKNKGILLRIASAMLLAGVFLLILASAQIAIFRADSQRASIFAPTEVRYALKEEELADLTKPSVVRIIQHIKGEAVIPRISLDFKTLTVALAQKGEPAKIPFDEYMTGSGFIVSPDGYILTNAHVISDETMKLAVSSQMAAAQFFVDAMKFALTKKDEELKSPEYEEKIQDFAKKTLNFLKEKSTFKFEKTLVVVNPASKEDKLESLMSEGFRAQILKVNDDFYEDERDVGLIKIAQKNLPSINFGESKNAAIGKRIYVFGFPQTAAISKKDLLEPTFTQGVISSIKDSSKKDFKILQTDAKISQGSSGGPMLNEKGEVMGLIAFQTGEFARQAGDNFAFAVPIEIAKTVSASAFSSNQLGNYGEHFLAGLNLLKNSRCGAALKEFESAKNSSKYFDVESRLGGYIQKCEAMIAGGQSIDTVTDELKVWAKSVGRTTWMAIGGGALLLIILAAVVIWLMKKMRRDEGEIHELERRLQNGVASIEQEKIHQIPVASATEQKTAPAQATKFPAAVKSAETVLPIGTKETAAIPANPELVKYAEAARKAGMNDATISAELKKAGWKEDEINASIYNR